MNHANGDTARPAPRFRDDHYEQPRAVTKPCAGNTFARYSIHEYMEFAPYTRLYRGGRVIRIETDGNGRLVEYVECTNSTCYGVPRDRLYTEERPNVPKQRISGYDVKRAERRRRRQVAIHKWLKDGPRTKGDVARRFGISNSAAWHDLAFLRSQGKVEDVESRNANGHKGQSLWRAL